MDQSINSSDFPDENSKPSSASIDSLEENSPKLILVTGGSGYLALHILEQLSKDGHRLRTTVRNLNDNLKIDAIKRATKSSKWPIDILYADLNTPESWKDTCNDVNIVMHVASPCPTCRKIDDGLYYSN